MAYYIKPKFAHKTKLLIKFEDEYINLAGGDPYVEHVPGTSKRPPVDVEVRPATQEELQILLENPEQYGDYSKMIGKKLSVAERKQLLAAAKEKKVAEEKAEALRLKTAAAKLKKAKKLDKS